MASYVGSINEGCQNQMPQEKKGHFSAHRGYQSITLVFKTERISVAWTAYENNDHENQFNDCLCQNKMPRDGLVIDRRKDFSNSVNAHECTHWDKDFTCNRIISVSYSA